MAGDAQFNGVVRLLAANCLLIWGNLSNLCGLLVALLLLSRNSYWCLVYCVSDNFEEKEDQKLLWLILDGRYRDVILLWVYNCIVVIFFLCLSSLFLSMVVITDCTKIKTIISKWQQHGQDDEKLKKQDLIWWIAMVRSGLPKCKVKIFFFH